VAEPGVSLAEAIEKIDIDGPSMIRSAAKNHAYVGVVVDPADYPAVLEELGNCDGALSQATRSRLALEAFRRTAAYDTAISMLELSEAQNITLTAQTYRQFVLDEWDWMDNWLLSNAAYSKSAADIASAKGLM